VSDILANKSDSDEPKSIESKSMAITVAKMAPDGNDDSIKRISSSCHITLGKASLSAGDTSIRLPGLGDLNTDSDSSSAPVTKILESKENPYASAHGNSSVQGSVVTIILSRADGSEISVQNTSKPISIRLNRPLNKRPTTQEHQVQGTSFQYHRVRVLRDPCLH
jgi:hypothetical protein